MRKTKFLKTFLLSICGCALFFGVAVEKADATLRFYDGFENGSTLNYKRNWFRSYEAKGVKYYNGPEGTLNIVNTKAAQGNQSLKVALEYNPVTSVFRNQLNLCRWVSDTQCSTLYLRENGINWIGFSTYHPGQVDGSEYWAADNYSEQFFQIHTPPYWTTDSYHYPQGPAVSLDTGDNDPPYDLFQISTDSLCYKNAPAGDPYNCQAMYGIPDDGKAWAFSYDKGIWVHWVVAYKPSTTSGQAITKVWRKRVGIDQQYVLIVDDTFVNSGFLLTTGNFFLNIGIYKRPWQNNASNVTKRTMYFDEIRVGDIDSSFEEVDPSQGPPECNDGIDNDDDGKTDWNSDIALRDPDCTQEYGDDSESGIIPPQYLPVDVNQDTKINIQDIQIVVKVITGALTNPRADVNGDGVKNIKDIQQIVRAIVNP